MTGTRAEIVRAEVEAADARTRIDETVIRLKSRLNPAVRVREVWEDVRDRGEVYADDALEFAYERPRAVAGATAVTLLFLLRRPIFGVLRRLMFWRRSKWDNVQSTKVPVTKALGRSATRLSANPGDRK